MIFNQDNCYIIAELSANHGGDIEIAKETVRAAKRTGADAIKLQTYTADTITLDVKNEHFRINQGTSWDGKYFHDLYKEASLPWEWHAELMQLAREEGLDCFSSPFDFSAVDFLEDLNVPAYKIASFEITDIPLIRYVASKNKPVIISTGIASDEDIQLAVDACRSAGNNEIVLLKCTSSYPAPIEDANLSMIKDLADRFDVVSGLSDHTLGITVPVVAVTLGAKVIEKHFILDKKIGGADASFSLDEEEFTMMVRSVRAAESAIGKVDYQLTDKQLKSREFSRSLYISEDVKDGDIISKENVRSVRPGFGMHPKHYNEIMGMKFTGNHEKGTPLEWSFIEKNI